MTSPSSDDPVDVRIGPEPIDTAALARLVERPDCGAVATFAGTVRGVTGDRETVALEYEAHETMAVRSIRRIAADAVARFGVRAVAVRHRTGRLEVGETSVAIAVAAPHRGDAFAACAFVIDTLKADAPIWKKEHGPDETFWVDGPGST